MAMSEMRFSMKGILAGIELQEEWISPNEAEERRNLRERREARRRFVRLEDERNEETEPTKLVQQNPIRTSTNTSGGTTSRNRDPPA